jgi:hypothetical protein
VLAFTPEGKDRRVYATGLRNCVGMAVQPRTDEVWCSVNERDGLGDDLVPDFVTRVHEGAFYGWPWFYIGGNEDPRRAGEQPALRDRVSVPDVLLQPHSASMQMTFYNSGQFPAEYRGDIFVAFHGSWNRSRRTGYKVVRLLLNADQPTGEYEDFLTGFAVDDGSVWARPVGSPSRRTVPSLLARLETARYGGSTTLADERASFGAAQQAQPCAVPQSLHLNDAGGQQLAESPLRPHEDRELGDTRISALAGSPRMHNAAGS